MVHVDVNRVRGKMAEKGFNNTSISDVLGISRNTFALYLKEPKKIPYDILAKLAIILCDTPEEAARIFFAPNLRETKEVCRHKNSA